MQGCNISGRKESYGKDVRFRAGVYRHRTFNCKQVFSISTRKSEISIDWHKNGII
jgi:hypothetical protein